MKITNETAAQKIMGLEEGQVFTVSFIKRTTGEVRVMQARKGPPAQENTHNLCTVVDVALLAQKVEKEPDPAQYEKLVTESLRNINLESIIDLTINNVKYEVNDFPIKPWIFEWSVGKMGYRREVLARTQGEADITFKRLMKITRLPNGTKSYCV